MTKTIENLFLYLSVISDILIVLLFIFYYKKLSLEKGLWAIAIYCISSLVLNYVGDDILPGNYKYVFYTFFTLFEYLIFASFLWLAIKNKKFKKVVFISGILFTVFVICYLAFLKPQKIDSLSIAIETILIMVFSFYYLYEQMNNTNDLFIYSKYEFWVITGLLVYLAGSFFIYIFASQVDHQFILKYWFLTNAFYIIKNLFFGIGIFHYLKKLNHSDSQKKLSSQKFHAYMN